MPRTRLLLLALLLVARPALAQPVCTTPSPQTNPPTFTCAAGVPHTLLFDYAPDATNPLLPGDVFRVYLDALQVGADIPARQATGISVQLSAPPPGTYTVGVSTVRPGALIPESVRAQVTLVLVAPVPPTPTPPTNLRIVEIVIRGLDSAGLVLWEQTVTRTAVIAP